jgi:hypothetical protein
LNFDKPWRIPIALVLVKCLLHCLCKCPSCLTISASVNYTPRFQFNLAELSLLYVPVKVIWVAISWKLFVVAHKYRPRVHLLSLNLHRLRIDFHSPLFHLFFHFWECLHLLKERLDFLMSSCRIFVLNLSQITHEIKICSMLIRKSRHVTQLWQ